ncbi:MAG: hypothetical protein ACO2ZM_02875 [Francisellaceae bacterium]
MFKKLTLLSLMTVIGFSAAYAHQKVEPATIDFMRSQTVDVKSKTALVNVTVNATALQNDSTTIESATLSKLKAAIPNIDWKVLSLTQNEADSGAQNIKIIIEGRLSAKQITTLRKLLQNDNSNNQRFIIDVVSFTPTEKAIEDAQNDLMISMYQSIQKYVKNFNSATDSQYQIAKVDFHGTTYEPGPQINTMMLMKTASDSAKEDNIAVTKKITLNANITLSQINMNNSDDSIPLTVKSGKANDKPITATKALPPAYLGIKGFEQCLSKQNNGSWSSWCMPDKKPQDCADDAWQALLKLDDIPQCR